MKNERNPLFFFVRSELSAALAVSLAATPLALFAQEAETDEDEVLVMEEVFVTGSRILRDGFTSSSPLAVFDEQDIILAGNASIDEFLKYVPQFTGYQMGMSTNNKFATA